MEEIKCFTFQLNINLFCSVDFILFDFILCYFILFDLFCSVDFILFDLYYLILFYSICFDLF